MEENELFEDLHIDNDQTDDVPENPKKVRKTAADFFRPIQVSPEVVRHTMGIDTDHITPELLMAASRKVLGISRGQQQSDDRDSLEYQRVYGSAEYLPEHIQKDGGRVARNILWKATNRGNLDFIGSGALEPHVDSVFNESKLAQYIDGANMFESLDANTKITRIGEGGVGDQRMAPDEMRGINNSFLGYVDSLRFPECTTDRHQVYTKAGWKNIADITVDDEVLCFVDGKDSYNHPTEIHRYEYDGALCAYDDGYLCYEVTPNHRMYVATDDINPQYSIMLAGNISDRVVMTDINSSVIHVNPEHHSVRDYRGYVYCLTVPGGIFYTRVPGHTAFWTGNSLRIGLDSYMAKNTRKGSDGKLYTRMTDARTGEERWVDSVTMARAKVATAEYAPGGKYGDDKFVPIPRGTKGIVSYVPRNEIDFYSTRPDEMMSLAANTVPFVSGIKEMRAMLGSKHFASTVPLDNPETPWVSVVDPDTGKSIESKIGAMMGLRKAEKDGVVTAVRKDRVEVSYADGTKGSYELYQDYPNNQKGFINSTPLVKAGDKVSKGTVLARTNFTNDKGEAANGVNLRTAFLSWNGLNYEDAKVISDYAAKKLSSTTMYKTALDLDKSIKLGKANYLGMKPGEYSKEQMDTIGADGLVKVGTKVSKGDPIYVGVRIVPPSPGSFGKRQFEDITEVWEHDNPGIVTDVVQTKKGLKVFIKSSSPVVEGDKLSNFAGMKGVVAAIIPRDKMPKDENGDPIDVLESPLGIISRTNSAFASVMLLSEIARKRKQPYYVDNFPKEDINEFVINEAKKYNVPLTRTLTDPETGRKIKNVQVGSMFIYKQKHMSEGKESARGTSGYNAEDIPSRGGYEGCLYGGTMITTDEGKMAIRDIVKGKLTPNVLSYNRKTAKWEYNKVTDWFAYRVPASRIRKYELEGGVYTLYATDNHEVYDNFGEKAMLSTYEIGDLIAVYSRDVGSRHLINSRKLVSVASVPRAKDYIVVYDITVENVHNYVANNILVSNSKRIGNMETAALASHGCFMGSVNVLTDQGYLEISKIVSKRMPCNVYTMLPDGSFGWRPVTDWFVYSVDSSELWKIDTTARSGLGLTDKEIDIRKTIRSSHKAIRCTKDHKFYTPNGKIQAQDLKPGDLVYNPGIKLTDWQMAMLRGCLMGDGCCVSPRTRPTEAPIFTVTHGYTQYSYIDWMYEKLKNVVYNPPKLSKLSAKSFAKKPTKKLQAFNCYQITQLNKEFYGNDPDNRKRPPVGIIESMGWPGIGIWYADDGGITRSSSRYVSSAVNFHTCGFTTEDCEVLKEELISFTGLPWKIVMKSGKYPIITLSRGPRGITEKYLDKFARMISPYLPKMFGYKLEGLDYDKSTLGTYWDDKDAPPRIAQAEPAYVTKSEPYTPAPHENNLVYDITVDETHNFIVHGVVVSNSWSVLKDSKLVRGQANQDFWRSIRTGEIPVMPTEPIVYQKFYNHLKASGVNIKRTDTGLRVFPLTDEEAKKLTGARELNSTDTFDATDYTPIKGGLFGSDIFGSDGAQWGYIQLDEPMPNPVMEEPLRRILRMSQKDFESVLAGEKELNGLTGGVAIKAALDKIDMGREVANAEREFKSATKSRKDEALKRFVELSRMEKQGTKPSDFMLTRIPVLPAKYRPVMSSNGLTMVSDSNYLYKQMIEARDDLRAVKDLPPEVQGEARAGLYRSWKELTGMIEPSSPKLKQKAVKGLLRWALGNSPKTSAVMQKMLTSTVDTVGRGVIAPDPSLKLDEIGIPKSMAFHVYKPFVTRALVNMNYTPLEAMKQVESQTPVATDVLMKVMEKRPAILNRAPSLHKFSLMGFKPKMTAGHIIRVNPSVVGPFAADFDGDTIRSLLRLEFDREEIIDNFSNSDLTFSINGVLYGKDNKPMEECSMFSNLKIGVDNGVMRLEDLPVIEGSEVKKSTTVTEWDVVPGFYTTTVDPETGGIVRAPITKVSKHEDLKMYDCELTIGGRYGTIITASEDHSLITVDPNTLDLVKSTPMESVGRLAPRAYKSMHNDKSICNRYMDLGVKTYMSYNLGVFIGTMIGDGWVSINNTVYIACDSESLRTYLMNLLSTPDKGIPVSKSAVSGVYNYGEGSRISNKDAHRITVYMDLNARKDLRRHIGSGAENKHIPYESLGGSRAHMLGVLMGLLATDGTVRCGKAAVGKKSSSKQIKIDTVSPYLRDGIQTLCSRLGINTSVVPYMGPNSKHTCYLINLCIPDVVECYNHNKEYFVIPVKHKQEALEAIVQEITESGEDNQYDVVPFPVVLWGICSMYYSQEGYDLLAHSRKRSYMRRGSAKRIVDFLKECDLSTYTSNYNTKKWGCPDLTPAQVKEVIDKWDAMVNNEDIVWRQVVSVTESSCTEGWDCTVPGPYTFSLYDGTIVQDTANVHVPVSDAAVREVYEKMLPQQNLLSVRKHSIQYPLEKEYRQGIYLASRMKSDKAERTVDSIQEAIRMYNNNEIDIDTPIEVRHK